MAAAVAGVPVGVAIGRWAWRLVADQLGVVPEPIVPPLGLLAVAAGAVLAANLVAAGPGWVAGRLRPAAALAGRGRVLRRDAAHTPPDKHHDQLHVPIYPICDARLPLEIGVTQDVLSNRCATSHLGLAGLALGAKPLFRGA